MLREDPDVKPTDIGAVATRPALHARNTVQGPYREATHPDCKENRGYASTSGESVV